MKKIFTLTALVSISFIGHSQIVGTSTTPPKAAVSAPDMLGLKEPEFDFGKIPQGKPVTHNFEVYNVGKDSVRITNVQASCGCTTPEWERNKVLAPGDHTVIKVGYNAAAEGAFTKLITITYNENQSKQITIKGEVWKTPASSAPENNALKSLQEN